MERSMEELEQKAYRLGEKYERECTDCAQTAFAAIFDRLGIENEDVFRSASGLADGLGLTGDGSCGALAIGYLFGRKRQDLPDIWICGRYPHLWNYFHPDGSFCDRRSLSDLITALYSLTLVKKRSTWLPGKRLLIIRLMQITARV